MSEERVGGKQSNPRIVLTTIGLVAAPVLGAMACIALTMVYTIVTTPRASFEGIPQAIAAAGLFGGYYGAIPSLIVGWPIHLMMQRLKLVRMLAYALGGLLIGILCLGIMWITFGGSSYVNVGLHIMFALAGAIGGLVFWLIRRPDRDALQVKTPEDVGGA